MLTVTLVMCGWCRSPRPLEVRGIDNLPPGLHVVTMNVTDGICIPCGTKFSDMIEKGGATQSGTPKRDHTTEGKSSI